MAALPSTSALAATCNSCGLRPASTSSLRDRFAGFGITLTEAPWISGSWMPAGIAFGIAKTMAWASAGNWLRAGKRSSR
ncbi:hypothetical protein D3C71_1735050 [compost metagenome]